MKLSARNVLEGKVLSIKKGPVSTEVDIETKGGERVVERVGAQRFLARDLLLGVEHLAARRAAGHAAVVRGDRVDAFHRYVGAVAHDHARVPERTPRVRDARAHRTTPR